MCGIAGIVSIGEKGTISQALVQKMTNAMLHRGPNADGFYIDDDICLGHRRLSIIDLTESANQPFPDASGRYQMVFNGELFNFRAIRSTISDHEFRTTSDTEVLIELFARNGIDAVGSFKGMFAFAVWDKFKKELFLVRDRIGVKPLYYYLDEEKLVFASEIRAILATGLINRKINKSALAGYLKYQSVCSSDSIIEGIKELPSGCFLKLSGSEVEISRYWDVTDFHPVTDNESTVKKRILNLLQGAVEQRLISDVPIGAFLSGGIDSSAVVGLMSRVSKERPVTFNIGFAEKEFDESDYAEIVGRKFNTRHQSILMRPSTMLDELRNALDAMDTPSGDGINTYVISKAVKKAGLTVALSGVGGDELFAGYPFFPRYHQLRKYHSIWNSSYNLRKSISDLMPDPKWRDLLRVRSTDIASLYPVLRQVVSDDSIGIVTNLPLGSDPLRDQFESVLEKISLFPFLSQVSIAEYIGYTKQTLLKDIDQMSMAVSLEVREPFFDHELIEYVLGVPDSMKYPNSPKKLLVESLGDLLPTEIVQRKKQGFTFPWALWMKNELRTFCEMYIKKICQRDFINAVELEKKWNAFLNGDKHIRWMELWLFVILEYWLEKNEIS